jgi:hypothetical protein
MFSRGNYQWPISRQYALTARDRLFNQLRRPLIAEQGGRGFDALGFKRIV